MRNFNKIGTVIADPIFVSSSDFHLQSSSSAREAGMKLGMPIGYDGNHILSGKALDIGASEYIQAG